MPSRPLQPCAVPTCDQLVSKGRCERHRLAMRHEEDEARGTAASRGYDRSWGLLRREILERDHYTCRAPGCYAPAEDVDHVVPKSVVRRLGWSRAQMDDPSNLQSLCGPCHDAKTAREKTEAAIAAKSLQSMS